MSMPPPPPPPGPGSVPPPPPGFGATPPPPPGSGATAPPPPPGAVAAPPAPQPYGSVAPTSDRELAGFGSRLGAWLLDGLLYGLLSLVFVIPGVALIAYAFRDCTTFERSDGVTEVSCGPDAEFLDWGSMFGGIALMAVGVLVVAFLYVRAMGKTGQPWGARIVGVRVVDQRTGEPIGFWRALGRGLFANIFSSAIFYLGYLWMLWDDENQTWQDKVVNSVVVKT